MDLVCGLMDFGWIRKNCICSKKKQFQSFSQQQMVDVAAVSAFHKKPAELLEFDKCRNL